MGFWKRGMSSKNISLIAPMTTTNYQTKFQKDNMKKVISLSLIAFLFCINSVFAQFTIPEKPEFQTSVYDYANLLSSSEKMQLEDKLVRYSDSTSTQIVVISIESLKGEYIGELAPK